MLFRLITRWCESRKTNESRDERHLFVNKCSMQRLRDGAKQEQATDQTCVGATSLIQRMKLCVTPCKRHANENNYSNESMIALVESRDLHENTTDDATSGVGYL